MSASGTCSAYDVTFPTVVGCGPILACPGDIVVVDQCNACTSDPSLRLVNAVGTQVQYEDNGCGDGSECTLLRYAVPWSASCQNYTVNQGCFRGHSCTATSTFTVTPSDPVATPTPYPTMLKVPTTGDVNNGTCPSFSTTAPDLVGCGAITACPGETITVSDCSDCTGDTYFYLDDAAGVTVDEDDDGCTSRAGCSKITYAVPTTNAGCQDYLLRQTCYARSTNPCSGTTTYEVSTTTAGPTRAPSLAPTRPTVAPSKGVEAYVTIYNATDDTCVSSSQAMVVDSGSCTALPTSAAANTNTTGFMKVECASNAPDATWTAKIYNDDSTCSSATARTITGGGSQAACDNSCTYLASSGSNVQVNCGGTACTPLPRAYVTEYDSATCSGTHNGREVSLDECLVTPYLTTPYARFSCATQSSDSDWTITAYSDASCSTAVLETIEGSDSCDCPVVRAYGEASASSVTVNCGGNKPSVCPPVTVQQAYLSFYGSDSCDSKPEGAAVPLETCFKFPDETLYGKLSCDALTSGAAWNVTTYQSATCNPASVLATRRFANACECGAITTDSFDDYIVGVAMTLNCGSTVAPPSCDFKTSSSSAAGALSSAEVGGIVGGVIGGVLLLALVGLWIGGVIGFGGTSAAAGTAPLARNSVEMANSA